VGVARALAADPPVLLMDEPFAAVDPVTRLRLQDEFLNLQQTLRKTIVFVTHDIDEAARMGDRIAVLSKGGVLEQHDSPAEVLGRPATPFVADFVGIDRGVKRLAVVGVDGADLFVPPVVAPSVPMGEVRSVAGSSEWAVVVDQDHRLLGWITVGAGASEDLAEKHLQKFAIQAALGTTLKRVLGYMLEFDISWVPVVEGERFLGVVTPNGLHAAMRRSVGGEPLDLEG
jgi:osmoprotectant transport system ATP-binding protein